MSRYAATIDVLNGPSRTTQSSVSGNALDQPFATGIRSSYKKAIQEAKKAGQSEEDIQEL